VQHVQHSTLIGRSTAGGFKRGSFYLHTWTRPRRSGWLSETFVSKLILTKNGQRSCAPAQDPAQEWRKNIAAIRKVGCRRMVVFFYNTTRATGTPGRRAPSVLMVKITYMYIHSYAAILLFKDVKIITRTHTHTTDP
jgi:hypothetical protein